MGGYQDGRGDSTGEDPRSQRPGGGRRGYGPPDAGSGSPGSGARGSGPRGYGSGASGESGRHGGRAQGEDPFGGAPPPGPPTGGSGRGYGGSAGSRRRPPEDPTPGEVPRSGYGSPSPSGYPAAPEPTVAQPTFARPTPVQPTVAQPASVQPAPVQDAAEAAAAGPRRSRLEERLAARAGRARGAGPRDAAQERSERYPESALNGRSTRNGAAARARARGRTRPAGPVRRTGYHRYFDYPRAGKYGWQQWVPSVKQITGCCLAGFFLLIGLVFFEYESVQIPDPHSLAFAQQTSYTYDDGSTQFASEGSSNRTLVGISQIPAAVQNAVVAQEDRTFWTNSGVSYTGTARALMVDLLGGDTQGGSTITQQYVKQAYLTADQTTSRKIDEIFISLKLAKTFDKQTVLADYFDVSPFGRNTNGIAQGVKLWFGIDLAQMAKEPQALQDDQAAFLAAMVNSPTTYSNGWNPAVGAQTEAQDRSAALTRWHDTLSNMRLYGYITASDYAWAAAHPPQPIPLSTNSGESVLDSQMQTAATSWLEAYESQNPNSQLPSVAQIQRGGYTVVTTFNKTYMQYANSAVTTQLLAKENKVDKATLQAGLAAVDPATGDLVAFYGGDASQNNYENNATQRTEQAGSTFKAFTLATAFSQGWSPNSRINGASPWPDEKNPTEVQEDQGSPSVSNDDGNHGMMSLQAATDASVNTAFIRMEEQVQGGYSAVHSMAEKFGLNDADMNTNNQWESPEGCNNVRFTLGICFTDPARMADVYSVFAANGTYHPLTEVLRVVNNTTGEIYKVPTSGSTAVDPNVAAEVTKMFQGVIQNSDGTAHTAFVNSGLHMANIAGKTGTGTMDITTQTKQAEAAAGFDANACSNSDSTTSCGTGGVWFDGYSSKLAISVGISRWVNLTVDGQPKAVQIPVDNIDDSGAAYGAQFPFAIWASFMNQMQHGTPFAGDPGFTAPELSPTQIVMGSPTASATTAKPKVSKSQTAPTKHRTRARP